MQLDGVPVLSCITLVHTVGDREVTTIEGLRDHPLVDAFVRADALQCGFCTPGQIVSAAALVAANPDADARGDPARDGRQPLPLRHLPAHRGGDLDVARLIRTEKEVEGRYEEVWTLVDEDALEQWPAGPLDVVGRAAPRVDGLERARGEARYTADVQLPGMLHTAVLRSPHARATRAPDRPRRRRSRRRASCAAIGPGEIDGVDEEAGFEGDAVAAVAAETREQAERGRGADRRSSGRSSSRSSTPDEAVARGSLVSEPRTYERGDLERGLAEADVVVEAEYRTQTLLHNSMETHQRRLRAGAATRSTSTSRRSTSGAIRDELAEALGLRRGQGARRLRVHGRRLRREERAPATTP